MKKTNSNPYLSLGRRDFLKMAGGCGAMSSLSILSTLVNLQMTKAVMSDVNPGGGYKALVCLFFYGGNDSYNMLTPYDNVDWQSYRDRRGGIHSVALGGNPAPTGGTSTGLAHPKSDAVTGYNLLQIAPANTGGKTFGLHPSFSEMQSLFNSGNASFITNVGSLVEPTSRDDYNKRFNTPAGLFSHSDEQRNWQTAVPQSRSNVIGWCGRMADAIRDNVNNNTGIALSIALNSVNVMQRGQVVTPYIVSQGNSGATGPVTNAGATTLSQYGITNPNTERRLVDKTTDGILAQTYSDLLQDTFRQNRQDAAEAAIDFNNFVADDTNNPLTPDRFADAGILGAAVARQLRLVAKTIKAYNSVNGTASGNGRNINRHIFFVNRGGFDNHDVLITAQSNNLREVSQAVNAFYQTMVDIGRENDVVLFTASDFSRTWSTNGDGSDHAWGANHFMVTGNGGHFQGGRLFGNYPPTFSATAVPFGNNTNAGVDSGDSGASGSLDNIDTGRGRLIPTTAVDQYAAELCTWFGVPNDANLDLILPNIRNFPASGGAQGPLKMGFLRDSNL